MTKKTRETFSSRTLVRGHGSLSVVAQQGAEALAGNSGGGVELVKLVKKKSETK